MDTTTRTLAVTLVIPVLKVCARQTACSSYSGLHNYYVSRGWFEKFVTIPDRQVTHYLCRALTSFWFDEHTSTLQGSTQKRTVLTTVQTVKQDISLTRRVVPCASPVLLEPSPTRRDKKPALTALRGDSHPEMVRIIINEKS